ncbi:MAG: FAD-dependent oxidoreductase [Chloroflexi bacterium]|nr:FAD-dependent oxidoreductase [Chloroflexota bacterium]
MWAFETEVSEVIQRTPGIKSFRFPVRGKGVRYVPGQFFFITIKVKGEDAIHHFSFSSSPTEKGYIEFTKRITQSDFSQALAAIKPGTWAHLQGPEGTFTLPRKLRKLGFLSGGIGITPLRSMLRYLADRKLPYDVVLFYGNNNYEDIAFRRELDEIAASNGNIRVEYILSGPDFPQDWKGEKGFINKDMVGKLIPDFMERLFYISGPPRMVLALEEQLAYLHIPQQQVKRDSFTGYD